MHLVITSHDNTYYVTFKAGKYTRFVHRNGDDFPTTVNTKVTLWLREDWIYNSMDETMCAINLFLHKEGWR